MTPLARVLSAARLRDRRRSALAEADDALSQAVRDALAAKVPARVIAAALGVDRSRVYQLRDGTR